MSIKNLVFKSLNVLRPLTSEKDSERSGSTAKHINIFRKNEGVPPLKRKASRPPELPSKRSVDAGEPIQVSAVNIADKKGETCAEQLPTIKTHGMRKREIARDLQPSSSNPLTSRQNNTETSLLATNSKACFEAKYLQLAMLGEGGFGSVYAGRRKADNFPVAIKHIPKVDMETQPVVIFGKVYQVPLEAVLMVRAAGGPASVGSSSAVSLLDWYDLELEVLLVMERPLPCVDLFTYILNNDGPLQEDMAMVIMKQLVNAAIEMHSKGVFHRDIKSENILIETGSDSPRVRIIDFGCGCIINKKAYHNFAGTPDFTPPEFYIYGSYEAGPTTVWQLGALLYEMLNGHQQFSTSKFIRKKIQFSSELSGGCQDLLKLCLAVNPSKRATLEQLQQHPWLTYHCSA